jgi:hypothetical protein
MSVQVCRRADCDSHQPVGHHLTARQIDSGRTCLDGKSDAARNVSFAAIPSRNQPPANVSNSDFRVMEM